MTAKSKKTPAKFTTSAKLISLISLIGLSISFYLAYIKILNAKSFCTLNETVSCDAVNSSIYSDIFGVPMSFLGAGYFGLVLLLILFKRQVNIYRFIFFLTVFVLMPSYYLTGIEIFVLQAYCILCEISKILMLAILALTFPQTKYKIKEALRLAAPVLIAGVAAAAITFFAQTGNRTKEDYSSFIDALNKKGVIIYKSITCTSCKRQAMLFGKAYPKLNAVECHPKGPNPEPERCLKMGINKTPTFIMEQDGKEIKRLEGLQQLDKISAWAEVKLESAK